MPGLVVVGAQWGDEGKGKIVDVVTRSADCVVRFQGGNNAGHTLVINGVKTKLSLLPSGILRDHTFCLIASGVVLDSEVLRKEIESLEQCGIKIDASRLGVDADAHLIMGYHAKIDQAREKRRGEQKIGTTGKGIGPAYEDRATRCGVRCAELFDLPTLKERLLSVVEERDRYIRHVLEDDTGADFDSEWSRIESAAQLLTPFITNGSLRLDRMLAGGAKVVFEGAQGTLLDKTHGTVPYVTSSHTIAGGVLTDCGIGFRRLSYVLAVAKAYCTRVGAGPFPTELFDATGEEIRTRGAEFGTVTGRPRRCGWFDAVAMRRAVRLNGADGLVITKLDVLSGYEHIPVCIGYELHGKPLEDLPRTLKELEEVRPIFEQLAGWKEPLEGITSWKDLPAACREYLRALGQYCGAPVVIASVGPERNQTLFPPEESFVKEFIS